jgi:tetratricopeptide (TPR) repeat protein
MKIFVSSTVKDLGDLRDELYRRLKELGHTAWFSEKDDFPINRHPDAMTNCLKVAEECDLFAVLLDKRAGLPYTEREGSPYPDLFGLTISEAEYRCARKKSKPVCIFIRKRAEHESTLYRQMDGEERKKLSWYSEPAVYEFYDRLMHEKPHIPWRYTFDSLGEIMGPLNAIIGKVQSSYTLPVPPQPYLAHPYPLQKNFTGRGQERQELTDWLQNDSNPIFAHIAIGGMGKSALTWYWLQEDVIKQGLAPEGIIWWSFYEKEREAGFGHFLDHAIEYASSGETNPKDIPSSRDKMDILYSLLSQKNFLLIFDGVERVLRAYAGTGSPYQGDAVKEDERGDYRSCIDPHCSTFLQMLTSVPKTKIVLTSRLFPKELDDLEGCLRKDLEKMDKADAVEFFKRQGVNGTRAEIEEACGAYDYHPLSLRLLSGMIVHDMKYNRDVKAWTRHNPLPKLVPKEHHILDLAYNSLDKHKQNFISKLAAFRNPMDYDAVSIFNDFGSDEEFNDVLRELVDRGMLFRDEKSTKFDLHPIVRRYCYDKLLDKEGVHAQLIDYFAAVPASEKVEFVDDLAPVIELYHHTVRAGMYDEARDLFYNRLAGPLYYTFGAYQTRIKLLRALFPDGEDKPPRLKREDAQAWTLNSLAASYALSGQSRKAIPLLERQAVIREKQGDKMNIAIGLGNLATQQFIIGELDAAESNSRQSIEICREIEAEFEEAIGHQELGRLLAYRGEFEESEKELAKSTKHGKETEDKQGICLDEAYRSLRSLFMSKADEALNAAKKAHDIAYSRQNERDRIQSSWLPGAAYLMKGILKEAEQHLNEALTRDRKINLVELEPDILLEFAKLRFKQNYKKESLQQAEEALQIADRCEYRLKQADIHNFLAEFYLDAGDLKGAKDHAEIAKERAECGYKPAMEKAENLLKEIDERST